ncbi:CRAL/TRIO domain-containing protein [Coprinopsis marcescibilis]|uniref:CRAL/TRIO domain-containing protein n=1 Tax=Coprinopsis marcescibilis TaxID=230819 RepID=A0A5C3KVY8_COPMA|nr:CRAL/TRIO domain-containing protein [Coprinopsis marcescibilis]
MPEPESSVQDTQSKASGTTTPATPVPDYVFTDPATPAQFVGHLGHLTEAQSESLEEFRALLVKEGLYKPQATSDDGTSTSLPSHDDPTLLRFLRARSFQPPAAVVQFKAAEEWRKQHDVENLFATGFTTEEIEAARMFYPRWTGRRDKQGLPLYVYRVSELEPMQKELDAVSAKRKYQRIIVLYEIMVRFSFSLCSHLPHPTSPNPISSTTTIIDLGEASFSSLFRLRGHFSEASKLATPYYPETLGTIVIVNSPAFFPTIWSWIKGWFDEVTRHKIHVLGRDAKTELLNLIHPQDLPKMYGGELEWVFKDQPQLDADAASVLPDGKMPLGPIIFQDGKAIKPEAPSPVNKPNGTLSNK